MCTRARNEPNFWVRAQGVFWLFTSVGGYLNFLQTDCHMDQGIIKHYTDNERHGSADLLGENSLPKKERKERSYPCGSGMVCAMKSSRVGDKCQDWLGCRCFVYFIMLVVKNIYIYLWSIITWNMNLEMGSVRYDINISETTDWTVFESGH